LAFEANLGQADPHFNFLARGPGYSVGLAPTEAAIRFRAPGPPSPGADPMVRMQLVAGNAGAATVSQDPRPARVNYLTGSDPRRWHTNVPTYGRVSYADIYPGIDVVYRGSTGQLEYDFVARPGADTSRVRLRFAGADGLKVSPAGDLLVHAGGQTLTQHAPMAYQQAGATRQSVASHFTLRPDLNAQDPPLVTFDVGAYDHSRPLVIDPLVLGYSTYLSGPVSFSEGKKIAASPDGTVIVAGNPGPDFPVTPGAFQTTYNGPEDAFVAKLAPRGNGQADLVWSTFLGGSSSDDVQALAVDAQGNVFVGSCPFYAQRKRA
jgi:hypothetical protein